MKYCSATTIGIDSTDDWEKFSSSSGISASNLNGFSLSPRCCSPRLINKNHVLSSGLLNYRSFISSSEYYSFVFVLLCSIFLSSEFEACSKEEDSFWDAFNISLSIDWGACCLSNPYITSLSCGSCCLMNHFIVLSIRRWGFKMLAPNSFFNVFSTISISCAG